MRRGRLIDAIYSHQRLIRRAAYPLAIAAAVALVALSPFALLAIGSSRVDWDRLSAVGQSYGAISAILSAAAVGGVAVTLIVQTGQVKDGRRFAVREMHRELLRMAIENPALHEAWGPSLARDVADPGLVAYTNLVLNYFVLLYQTDSANLDEIRIHIGFIAQSAWMQTYWQRTGHIWRIAHRGSGRIVVEVLDDEFRRAARRAPSEPAGSPAADATG